MAHIAERTGLSRPAIYQYFSSSEHVLGELLINDMADLSNEIDRLVAFVDDPMEQVRIWIHYSLAHISSEEHRVVREVSIKNLKEEQRGELMAMHGYFLTALIDPLSNMGSEDPTTLASMIFAAINAAAERITAGKSFVAEASKLERFVMAGVKAAL